MQSPPLVLTLDHAQLGLWRVWLRARLLFALGLGCGRVAFVVLLDHAFDLLRPFPARRAFILCYFRRVSPEGHPAKNITTVFAS